MRIAYAALALAAFAAPAHAQSLPSGGVEIATDENRRGLSWSQGRVSPSADLSLGLAGFDLSSRVVDTRDSVRHGEAAAVADLEIGRSFRAGGFELRGHATGHFFIDARGKMDYWELGGSAAYSLGPLRAQAGLVYAPDQNAIGGDNLYLYADARAGIPATPFSVSAGIGRSSGSTDDARAARLRPTGSYSDWHVGIERSLLGFTLGLDYVGTDIDRRAGTSPYADARHAGDRVIGRARLAF
ncbi:TorF family putative porin [Sphingomonas sp. CJ20]